MSKIKTFFESRYQEGRLIEADYSQLEIRALAELSKDRMLKHDLDSGVDLHRLNAANWLRKDLSDVTSEERRKAKQISFQLQYGASFNGIAKRNNISVSAAKEFISAYFDRYREVAEWQLNVLSEVENSRSTINKRTPNGYLVDQGQYTCPITRREYTFQTKDNKYTNGTSFYHPEIKNYPVQGFATADIVPTVLGRLMRQILKVDYPLTLVGTVHDSILVDTDEKHMYQAARLVKGVMEDVNVYFKEDYDYDLIMSYPVDLKAGVNWGEMFDIAPR